MTDFYTRAGDDGYTGLLGEGRIPKYHPRMEAVGAIDEATSALGLARAFTVTSRTVSLLLTVQRDLYHLMAEVAATLENSEHFRVIDESRVVWLEEQINALSEEVDVPKEFIIPGDSQSGAALALSRTVVRRAERRLSRLLLEDELENIELLRYLNRLSSLCFALELFENQVAGKQDLTFANE